MNMSRLQQRIVLHVSAILVMVATLTGTAIAQESNEDPVIRGLDKIALALELISLNYKDDIDIADLIESGIRGMLYQLDPHSTYFNPDQTRRLLTEQEGEYFGIGVTIGIRNEEMTVVSPMENSPAARQGIRTGDVITHIEGERTAGRDLEINARKLRGPAGTSVTVTIEREGLAEPFNVTITREKISLSTVQFASLIQDGVGYIRLTRFARTSGAEMAETIDRLKSEGLKGLILDLRSNPGGDLEQAVVVADQFLDNDVIVYTKGLSPASKIDFKASAEETRWRGPLVVLINRGSASGAEVVAGALQDQDRAILTGENSWGKGLVQSVIPLSHDAALALTTARYYTPSGRLIQREYTPGQFDRYFNPEAESVEQMMQPSRTSLGRIVYGGNGLQPDVIVEEPELSVLAQQVLLRGLIFDFVTGYLADHPQTDRNFEATEEIMLSFRRFVDDSNLEVNEEQWRQDVDFLAARIKYETVTRIAGSDEAFRAVLPLDRQVQKAIELLKDAEELLKRKLQQIGN